MRKQINNGWRVIQRKRNKKLDKPGGDKANQNLWWNKLLIRNHKKSIKYLLKVFAKLKIVFNAEETKIRITRR